MTNIGIEGDVENVKKRLMIMQKPVSRSIQGVTED
jgi:hypothetical protein